jgi:hypothetical protein
VPSIRVAGGGYHESTTLHNVHYRHSGRWWEGVCAAVCCLVSRNTSNLTHHVGRHAGRRPVDSAPREILFIDITDEYEQSIRRVMRVEGGRVEGVQASRLTG